jgi:Uma2 family endonuclease
MHWTMAQLRPKPATYEDIIALPEHLVGEIIAGELHTQPRPAPRHAQVSSVLGAELIGHGGRGGAGNWWILDEPELHLGPHVLVPDLAAWRRERMPSLPDTAWFELAPDWVCEVLSPGTVRIDRAKKMPIYGATGAAHLWLIDPDQRTLEAYENTGGRWLLLRVFENADQVTAAPFDAVAFDLGGLWAD